MSKHIHRKINDDNLAKPFNLPFFRVIHKLQETIEQTLKASVI